MRKTVAQIGVVLFLASMILPPLELLSLVVLLLAAAMPANRGEEFGSMWPLVGYDNVIDALYVRGNWLRRFQELDEADSRGRSSPVGAAQPD